MFSTLSEKVQQAFKTISGKSTITEDNIKQSLKEVKAALIEADVALEVITSFINDVKEEALGKKVLTSVQPGETLIKIVQDELTKILGSKEADINLKAKAPIVYLVAGLQGSGKTTSAAKLARYLKEQHEKKVLMVSVDIHRPAAIDQLQTLATEIDVSCFPSHAGQKPKKICEAALKHAKKEFFDILIVDTAGRLHIDDELMKELKEVTKITQPTEKLLVVDSMMGQDAAHMAKNFHEAIDVTGIILSKTDGDARGGAALSMSYITGQSIKFMGVGERTDALERFYPERMASRILGMGDIVSLVEEAERRVDKKQADKMAKKFKKGQQFDLNDFLGQIQQMKKMGGMKKLMAKMPNMPDMPSNALTQMDDKSITEMQSVIESMTPQEKNFPAVINGSRKKRIAKGCGRDIGAVNRTLKKHTQLQKMMKRFKGKKFQNKIKDLDGDMPAGLDPNMLKDLL